MLGWNSFFREVFIISKPLSFKSSDVAAICLFKVNNLNTRRMDISGRRSVVFIVITFEQILHIVLLVVRLTFNK